MLCRFLLALRHSPNFTEQRINNETNQGNIIIIKSCISFQDKSTFEKTGGFAVLTNCAALRTYPNRRFQQKLWRFHVIRLDCPFLRHVIFTTSSNNVTTFDSDKQHVVRRYWLSPQKWAGVSASDKQHVAPRYWLPPQKWAEPTVFHQNMHKASKVGTFSSFLGHFFYLTLGFKL